MGVEWNERVINICEGGWSYVAGPTGYAPSMASAKLSKLITSFLSIDRHSY
jgi:hypothetical protein